MRRNLGIGALIFLGLSILSPLPAWAREFRVGYGLDYSLNELGASGIDPALSDLAAGGHTSFFYLELPVAPNLFVQMSPGAMNFEAGESQFHVQYNLLTLAWSLGDPFFIGLGGGLGGCIATLTQGAGTTGTLQSGYFLRNSVFIWTAKVFLGYRLKGGFEVGIEGKALGFIDEAYKNLDTVDLGVFLSTAIK